MEFQGVIIEGQALPFVVGIIKSAQALGNTENFESTS